MSATQTLDPIFFTKDQLRVGSYLRHYGRRHPNTTWQVEKIVSWFHSPGARYYEPRAVPVTRHLTDTVHLLQVGSTTRRITKFSYLSYSAIWRLR